MNTVPPGIRLAFDCVVLTVLDRQLHVAIAKRRQKNEVGQSDPFPGALSLPGGYVREDEAIADTIQRRLGPEIGLNLRPVHFGVFDDPARDPRHRVVSIAYYALISTTQANRLSWGAAYEEGSWLPLEKLPRRGWAFDHLQIVRGALSALRTLAERQPIGFQLLPREFSIRELHELQQQIRGCELDFPNFRKAALAAGIIEEVGERPSERGLPTKLYRHVDRK